MQDKKDIGYKELLRFIDWIIKYPHRWEEIADIEASDSENLLEILKSLHDNEFHVMFLTLF